MDEHNRRILALLSHPSRVKLIELLGQKALQTDEMAADMPIELAGTVVHLNYLINEGVVHSKRYGRRVKYWLDRERFTTALADLCEAIGIRVSMNRSFKQEAPNGADSSGDKAGAPADAKTSTKKKTAAKKTATKKTTAKKTAAKKAATKKTAAKKAATKKTTTKKTAAKKAARKKKR